MKIRKSTLSLLAALAFGVITCLLFLSNQRREKLTDEPQTIAAEKNGIKKSKNTEISKDKIIEIKEKMFISQVNDVYLNPDEYMGKTIKIEGLYKCETNIETNQQYNYVMRYGPGCCGSDGNVGFEIAYSSAEDGAAVDVKNSFPLEDTWVEAVGLLDSYMENDYPYIYIKLNSLNEKKQRGSEFVSQ
ncbi:MAG: hypothetical protein Ta2B_04650 [Termitinemataceae bacterium]|nr:MAG: hypothetical protein Ta2B_04650 [Termitinemataceae bacterium]